MERKKGFTLIELLAVLLIIGVLSAIMIGTITNQVNKQKVKISDLQRKIIFEATNEYMSENEKYYEDKTEGKEYCISLESLVESKKLSTPLKDINTGKEIGLNKSVKVTVLKNENYDYNLYDDINCDGNYADVTPPSLNISFVTYTNQIEVTAICQDFESDIQKYEFSIDNGKTWKNNQKIKNYTFKKLKSNKAYKLKVRCTNGAGMRKIVSANAMTEDIITPEIVIESKYPTDTEYQQYTNLKINYNNEGMKNSYYYYKSTIDAESNIDAFECGNDTNPSECNNTKTKTLKAGYWYKEIDNRKPTIKFNNNGSLYAIISDGTNVKASDVFTLTKIDSTEATKTAPSVNLSTTNPTKSIIVIGRQEDSESGISSTEYGYSTSLDGTYTWQKENIIDILKSGTTYYFKTRVKNGSGIGWTESSASIGLATENQTQCSISVNTSEWATSKTATININQALQAGETLQYKLEGSQKEEWTNIDGGGTVTLNEESTISSPTYIYCQVIDGINTKSGETYTETHIDTENPGGTTVGYNSGSNSCSWKNNYNIALSSSDTASGIAHYEVDNTGDGNSDHTTGANFIPSNGYHSCNVRFRAVDNVGHKGEWTAVHHIHMDTQAPGGTTVRYNSGSNSCSWKNNYNMALSASDNVGIAHYEIDWTGDGVSDRTTGANFIPWNGYSSCNNRFRAVDHAGNKGAWSSSHHIHMDTQAPGVPSISLAGGASGQWSNSVTATASSGDNVGVAYYQYSHNGSSVAGNYPNPWTINWNGQWNFYVRSVDHAGNVSGWASPYTLRIARSANVSYTGYFANGQTLSGSDGAMVGVGNATKMYTIRISASSPSGIDGNVQYNVHRESHGWTGWLNAGTTACNGENKRIEGIQLRLTGNMANVFDIYYRVHVQSIGDLGWARNGEIAGSQGLCKRLEKIAIRIVPKDENPANYGINYGAATPSVTDASKTNCSSSTTCNKTCTRSVPYSTTCYKYTYGCTNSCSGTAVNPSYCGSSGCNCCRRSSGYSCTKYRTESYTCC